LPYLFVGTHTESLQSGRLVACGEQVEDSDLVSGDQHLIDEQKLIPQPQSSTAQSAPDTKQEAN
jgi:hypothetical protein